MNTFQKKENEEKTSRSIASSLCKFRIEDEYLITDDRVKAEIAVAFEKNRCFEFYPDRELIENIKHGDPVELYRERLIDIKNRMFDTVAKNDQTIHNRLMHDTRLTARLVSALKFFHLAIAEGEFSSILNRRIVIIKEKPGIPTIFHISPESTVIAHVGQGPPWAEIPTIYLGLNTFSALITFQKKGSRELFEAFKLLLLTEERAVETGYTHLAGFQPEVSRAMMFLVDEVIKNTQQSEVELEEKAERKPFRKFSQTQRLNLLKGLNARVTGDELNFHYEKNLTALKALEKNARRYKKSADIESMREIVRLLVAASGHDIHEIRNRANILLERIFAPKEFDAPLATKFINLIRGESYNFSFELPEATTDYTLRIYYNSTTNNLFLEKDIHFDEIQLEKTDDGRYGAEYRFTKYGHYDFAVIKKKQKTIEWIDLTDTNGRVNVIPDVRGEIMLEIFPDIHGHTKAYWRDESGHPGLIYNENGEVIRLGNLGDITHHLEDIQEKYCITSIYLLGTQKRGSNREDWAPEATSPSPFSPMSLIEIEPALGGEDQFRALIKKAHSLDIKIIIDIIPHINRKSDHLEDEYAVKTYDHEGKLVGRSSTDGKYGSWNDGKLLNYRKFRIWEWLSDSVCTLIEKFDIDGIRFDSAHAVPIMMKKNNYLYTYNDKRSLEEMVEGDIIVNDRENDHFITTGYYDCACRDQIAVPLHYYLMLNIERKLKEKRKEFFLHIAECFWGHERFLTRTGLIPYNSSLFKICENIIHGKTDVREIYHIYDNYFPSVLPEGTELLGILGNHDERRALNTFGHRGLRAAVALTSFMSNIIMDYEGSAEGEGWKVFLDNVYVNWNHFEYASHRSLETFYSEWYKFHREERGKGYLVWANNNMVAAAMKFTASTIWLGAFNFADENQNISMQFDNPSLPIPDDGFFRLRDIVYSEITGEFDYFKGSELKIARINSVVTYTDRIKLFKLERIDPDQNYPELIKKSVQRLCTLDRGDSIKSNFCFEEIRERCTNKDELITYVRDKLAPCFNDEEKGSLNLALKRIVFYLHKFRYLKDMDVIELAEVMKGNIDSIIRDIGNYLISSNTRGNIVFMSAEANPFSMSGGLANVVYELPREMAKLGEKVFVISALYRNGSEEASRRMNDAIKKYNVKYTGKNIGIYIMDNHYEIGVHHGVVDGIEYYLLDHHEFFDGLYWGITSQEKLRRRIAFSRACAEVIVRFELNPHFCFTNDAYAGIFNGLVKSDSYYINNPNFEKATFFHIIHNGGWQYFDAYERSENGFDLFNLFNLPAFRAGEFCDPVHNNRLSCMATGIRFADNTITVSPSYARQIEYACDGMEHLLYNVIGISNAIGSDFIDRLAARFKNSGFIERNYTRFSYHLKENKHLKDKLEDRYPEICKSPEAVYSISDPDRQFIVSRMMNKLLLQFERGLEVNPDRMLFTMIHRISEQKGFQLLLEASEGIFRRLGIQGIIGGAVSSGDRRGEEIAHGLYLIGQYYPELAHVSFGFQDVTVPLLASDFFCMPSMHEPGGISQLEAFAAGAPVIARATGGLRDTVSQISHNGDEIKGNGFLFSDYHSWAFYDVMERAKNFFDSSSDEILLKARKNARDSVYFWDRPARQYVKEIYDFTETIRFQDS